MNAIDMPEEYNDVPEDFKVRIREWIAKHVYPAKRVNDRQTSYGMKHILQQDTGIYVTNGAFKGAMLEAGYAPVDDSRQNTKYCILRVYYPDHRDSHSYKVAMARRAKRQMNQEVR